MAEIIIFADRNYGGLHTHVFQSVPDLTQLIMGPGRTIVTWNDQVSSFVVQSGEWKFFRDINFQTPVGTGGINSSSPDTFGRGLYSWVEDYGIPNDSISSIQPVVG